MYYGAPPRGAPEKDNGGDESSDVGVEDGSEGLTSTGDTLGTPLYMSPEQVNAEKVDFLTDIYSLGVTLFEMAVGKNEKK